MSRNTGKLYLTECIFPTKLHLRIHILKITSMKNIASIAVSVSFCFQKQYERQEKNLDLK